MPKTVWSGSSESAIRDMREHLPSNIAKRRLLSIVIPAYDEEEVLREFHQRLSGILQDLSWQAEVVYVNDGSTDGTLTVIDGLRAADPRVAIVDLSRNFGKEIALTAGLDHATGDAVVVIDADLQDPPELIPELVKYFCEGYDVVYAQRISRSGEGIVKRSTAHLFYRVIRVFSRVKIPQDTGDFRLLSRRAVESLKRLREQHRFMKGLFAWIGYRHKAVPYHREPRLAGHTKWNYWRLWNFALEGFTSFTIAPLKIATYMGLVTAFAAFMYASRVIYKTLIYGDPVAGYPSLMVAVLFLGGVQLMTIGILGEYLGRMFDETKRRPLYFLNDYRPAESTEKLSATAPTGI
jgi:glycosyltransferase involved in cell wall biosynthesis